MTPDTPMPSYLVTGGAGFIGSHLCEALLARGHRVIALDDLSTGRRDNIAHLEANGRFLLTVGSIADRAQLDPLVAGTDAVFHLAAAVGVRLVVENPARTIETNVLGTAAVLESASTYTKPVLLTSSSEVYGKSAKVPFSENDDLVFGNTGIGRWSYGCSKAVGEYLALAFARETRLPVIIARLFNTVGPRQTGKYGMVLPTFVRQALKGEPLTVHGDGTQRRCFCAVADVVAALIALLENPASAGQVVNIGSEEEISIGELAERVRALAGSSSPIVQVPYDQAWDDQFEDMQRRVPNLDRVRALIGFSCHQTLDDMIRAVTTHERARLSTGT
jgi:UDP-glucose 4-epimerase